MKSVNGDLGVLSMKCEVPIVMVVVVVVEMVEMGVGVGEPPSRIDHSESEWERAMESLARSIGVGGGCVFILLASVTPCILN